MRQHLCGRLLLLASVCLLTGCVERRFVITTEPPGAVVYDEKGMASGASPSDRQFVYYGKYRFALVKDGYQTLVVEEPVGAPWYEWFLLDFVSENLIPWTIRDVRRFHYVLQPGQSVPPEVVLEQATRMRERGLRTGTILPLPQPTPAPVDLLPPTVP